MIAADFQSVTVFNPAKAFCAACIGVLPSADLSIQPGDAWLQDCGKGNPQQVGNVCPWNPGSKRIDDHHGPDQREQNQKYIQKCEKITSQLKLQRGKSSVEHNIQNKWQKNQPGYLRFRKHKDCCAKREEDTDIKDRPHRAKSLWRWSPGRFRQFFIPLIHRCFLLCYPDFIHAASCPLF